MIKQCTDALLMRCVSKKKNICQKQSRYAEGDAKSNFNVLINNPEENARGREKKMKI